MALVQSQQSTGSGLSIELRPLLFLGRNSKASRADLICGNAKKNAPGMVLLAGSTDDVWL
jgi:hypothetical protein